MSDEVNKKTTDDTVEDIVPEAEEGGELSGVAKLKSLREKLKACETEKQEYLTGWQRAKADLINARKRDEEDRKAFAARATEDLVMELVPVLQSFDAAMADKKSWEAIDKNWRTGVEYIAGQLRTVLKEHGVAEIDPLGASFDPARDEAVEHVLINEKNRHNTVIEVLQKGYSLNGKTIRPPRVKVGDFQQ